MADTQPGPQQSARPATDPNELQEMATDALLRRIEIAWAKIDASLKGTLLYGSRTLDDGHFKNDVDLVFPQLQATLQDTGELDDYIQRARKVFIDAANTRIDDSFRFKPPAINKTQGTAFAADFVGRFVDPVTSKVTKVSVPVDSDATEGPVLATLSRSQPLSRHTKLAEGEEFNLQIQDPNETLAKKLYAILDWARKEEQSVNSLDRKGAEFAAARGAKHLLGVANALASLPFDLEKVATVYRNINGLDEMSSRSALKDHLPAPTTMRRSSRVNGHYAKIVEKVQTQEKMDPTLTPLKITNPQQAEMVVRAFRIALCSDTKTWDPEKHLLHVLGEASPGLDQNIPEQRKKSTFGPDDDLGEKHIISAPAQAIQAKTIIAAPNDPLADMRKPATTKSKVSK
ncbi:MAG: hypothetical protein HOQ05_08445 [Corynebacteriales bacterium]|nr:hypothetical protein [Mycobacteriales bacterium]